MKWELSGDALLSSRYMGKKGRVDCRHVLLAERKHGGVDLGPGETLGSASLYDLNNYTHKHTQLARQSPADDHFMHIITSEEIGVNV